MAFKNYETELEFNKLAGLVREHQLNNYTQYEAYKEKAKELLGDEYDEEDFRRAFLGSHLYRPKEKEPQKIFYTEYELESMLSEMRRERLIEEAEKEEMERMDELQAIAEGWIEDPNRRYD